MDLLDSGGGCGGQGDVDGDGDGDGHDINAKCHYLFTTVQFL